MGKNSGTIQENYGNHISEPKLELGIKESHNKTAKLRQMAMPIRPVNFMDPKEDSEEQESTRDLSGF